ncbi:MAG TPA: hypothetical protein VMU63_09800 [Acidimicrobiales bacterium]|nr:hypothetical protein [Acidimicrobiales bacterium]
MFNAPEYQGAYGMDTVQWYMAGRAAPLGAVSAEVACAVFGTFNPVRVHAGLDGVWSRIPPDRMVELKLKSVGPGLAEAVPTGPELDDAITILSGALAQAPLAGAPLFAALAGLPLPPGPREHLWRLCDMVREHRSDAHTGAWRAAGLDPVEVNVLNELWRGAAPGSISRALMGWEASDIAAATRRLEAGGVASGGSITPAGTSLREEIEMNTSVQQSAIVDGLGGDSARLIALLDPWAHAVADGS